MGLAKCVHVPSSYCFRAISYFTSYYMFERLEIHEKGITEDIRWFLFLFFEGWFFFFTHLLLKHFLLGHKASSYFYFASPFANCPRVWVNWSNEVLSCLSSLTRIMACFSLPSYCHFILNMLIIMLIFSFTLCNNSLHIHYHNLFSFANLHHLFSSVALFNRVLPDDATWT